MSRRPTSPSFVGAPPPTHDNSPPNSPNFFGGPSPPIPPPARRVLGKPPKHIKKVLTPAQKAEIEQKGVAGKGRKTKKRKSKSRRRRNGRTYRRS
jgi:hypothetical protein